MTLKQVHPLVLKAQEQLTCGAWWNNNRGGKNEHLHLVK
jgi:hypothetical protein